MKMLPVILCLLLWPLLVHGQTITTVAGNGISGYSGDGGPATDAKLHFPYSIKPDNSGNWYIADNFNHVIRKINSAGIISTVVGNGYNAGTWQGGYSGDGGLALSASLSKPIDMAFDKAGNMYIAENGNAIIRKVSTSGIVSTFAGIPGSPGYTGDGGSATAAKISNPLGLVFDTVGNLYFSNNGQNCIRKIDVSGNISTVVGTGVGGFSGDSGPATSAQIKLTGHVTFDKYRNLIVPDYKNHRIRKVDQTGIISTIAGNGSYVNDGDGDEATNASIGEMASVLCDNLNNMYLFDCTKAVIRKINSAGVITTIAGTGTPGFNGDGDALLTQFAVDLLGTAIDNWGNLYVADPNNHRIRKVVFNVGVNDIPNDIKSTLHPNPTKHEITITSTTPIQTLQITNILGQLVLTHTPNKKEITINIAHLQPGIYLAKINGTHTTRFVKE
jgi:hypothetical protein